jgi:hypothetical protein
MFVAHAIPVASGVFVWGFLECVWRAYEKREKY